MCTIHRIVYIFSTNSIFIAFCPFTTIAFSLSTFSVNNVSVWVIDHSLGYFCILCFVGSFIRTHKGKHSFGKVPFHLTCRVVHSQWRLHSTACGSGTWHCVRKIRFAIFLFRFVGLRCSELFVVRPRQTDAVWVIENKIERTYSYSWYGLGWVFFPLLFATNKSFHLSGLFELFFVCGRCVNRTRNWCWCKFYWRLSSLLKLIVFTCSFRFGIP